MSNTTSIQLRQVRHERLRKTVTGTTERPRLSVYRSLNNIYTQIIDDSKGTTLASASSLDKDIKPQVAGKKKAEEAGIIGNAIAKKALAQGIKQVVFDRGGYMYHGRVKSLAEAARKAGIQF